MDAFWFDKQLMTLMSFRALGPFREREREMNEETMESAWLPSRMDKRRDLVVDPRRSL